MNILPIIIEEHNINCKCGLCKLMSKKNTLDSPYVQFRGVIKEIGEQVDNVKLTGENTHKIISKR